VRHASISKLDKQGRIALNQNIISFSNINKNALIIGMVNKIEIWDPNYLSSIDKNFNEKPFELKSKIEVADDILNEIVTKISSL
jgi:DNA-binding transcriptional regulator/RsmH inhibitor MraZ